MKLDEHAGMYCSAGFTFMSVVFTIPVAGNYMWRPRQLESPIPETENKQKDDVPIKISKYDPSNDTFCT